MQINSLSREELQEAILQLEQALYNHQQWHNALIRSLTCRLPADQHDMSQERTKNADLGNGIIEVHLRNCANFLDFRL